MDEVILKTLRESPLFKHLNEADMNRVLEAATLREVSEGEVVIEEGSEVESLFVLTDGQVNVSTQSVGKDIELKTLGTGAYFGEVSLLSGKSATATVTARTPCTMIGIERSVILGLVEEDEKIRRMLEGLTLKRAKDTLGKVLQ